MTDTNERALTIPETVEGEIVREAGVPNSLAVAGQVANQHAAAGVLADYRERRAASTRRRHDADLQAFVEFLQATGAAAGDVPTADELASSPPAWAVVTWGIVEAFKRWQLERGYAINTINARLSTVRVYAGLAHKAGFIETDEYSRIQAVEGYSHHEGRHIDEARPSRRRGAKKAQPVRLTPAQARTLKNQPLDTPQGRRDAVLMCLLLDHGLRVSEVVDLLVTDVDMQALELRFYRRKVDKTQTHRLTPDTERALRAWFASGDAPAAGPLLRPTDQRGELVPGAVGISRRGVFKRVRTLGERAGIDGLSPHDCRHFWATHAAKSGTDAFSLKQAGGWASMATVARYIDEADVANEGVKLDGTSIHALARSSPTDAGE